MKIKTVLSTLFVVGVFVALAAAKPTQQTAVVTFTTPTIIANGIATGTVLFEHDAAKMARGEPCTTVYEIDKTTNERGRKVVEFMCLPRQRPAPSKFEAICARASVGGSDLLVEYQFAGDNEAHGVPLNNGGSLNGH